MVTAVVVTAALRLAAQGNALAVEGTVFDPSGGVLPGVEVTLEDGNKIKWPATTGADGKFKFDPVGAGTYVLEASLPGFKSLRHEFVLSAGPRAPQNVTLQVGSLQETIKVTARRPAPAASAAASRLRSRVMGGNIKQPAKRPGRQAGLSRGLARGRPRRRGAHGGDHRCGRQRVVRARPECAGGARSSLHRPSPP